MKRRSFIFGAIGAAIGSLFSRRPATAVNDCGTWEFGKGTITGYADRLLVEAPIVYGRVRNLRAFPQDPANLIFQAHDGSIAAIDAVYDNGLPLGAYEGPDPIPPGRYRADLANGTFQLRTVPAGIVTADVTAV